MKQEPTGVARSAAGGVLVVHGREDVNDAPVPRRRGRPRDADLEDRVFDAVLAVYAETSWRGFTLDAVGRRARVGRAALYRRWDTKDDLLVQALEARSPLPQPIDTGALRSDLTELARQLLHGYRTPPGLVSLRVALDSRVNPELLTRLTDTLNRSRILAARTIVHRAVARGELDTGTSVTLLLEIVTGAVLSHALFGLSEPDPGDDAAYADLVVDVVLGAIQRPVGVSDLTRTHQARNRTAIELSGGSTNRTPSDRDPG